jgi:hypothetical protein
MLNNESFGLSTDEINFIKNNNKFNTQNNTTNKNNKSQINSQKTQLHNSEILEIHRNIIKNAKSVHGKDFNYEQNLEFHIHDKLIDFLAHDLKIKNSSKLGNFFKSLIG